ncbi:MAG TPA: STAS domain-containing protein [Verrucomicrobiae bacterium]|jgi:anti-anti-sigma regulatory factor
MTTSASLSVLVGKDFACVKITGRANFTFSPDFKALLTGLTQKGYKHFILDLSECLLMDSTFLGTLAAFGLTTNPAAVDHSDIELCNPSARVAELLENLGVIELFKVTNGPLKMPCEMSAAKTEQTEHSREEITRTCLEAHKALMAANPQNVVRFKDVTQFLAEDLKNLQKAG